MSLQLIQVLIVTAAVLVILVMFCVLIGIIYKIFNKVPLYSVNDLWLVNEFKRCNVIVFGKKGSGKDLLFAHAIALRNELHYSNINYNGLTEVRPLTDLSVGDNTFEDCINGTIRKFDPTFEENKDFYVSDGGIYLPCQYNKQLNEFYPSMPMFYALSRHLYNMNVHVNVQALTRLWDKLREQADSYIRVLKTVDKGEYLQVSVITYDSYNSAERGLLPSNDKQFTATNGEVTARKFRIYKNELEYDTRYFRDVFLNRKKSYLEGVLYNVKRPNK